MKKKWWVVLIILIVIIAGMIIIFKFEKNRIKKENEQLQIKSYIKTQKSISTYTSEQQKAIVKATMLYNEKKAEGMNFSSQCLGVVDNYAVDIVNVPRNEEDNKVENQCAEFREGKVNHFIELDKEGNLVRIY